MESNQFLQKIGENIRIKRSCANLSRFELANRIGMNPGHYGQIERGKHNMSLYTLQKIAMALECKVYDLMPKDC